MYSLKFVKVRNFVNTYDHNSIKPPTVQIENHIVAIWRYTWFILGLRFHLMVFDENERKTKIKVKEYF